VEQIGHYLLPGIFIKSMNGVVSQEVEEEGRIYETMIWINAFLNREDFLLAAVKALNFSERRGYPLGVVLGSGGLEGIAQFLSFFRISEYYGSKTLRFSEKMQYRGALGYAYQGIAYHNFLTGNLNKAIEYARRAADAYRKGGSWNLRGWGIATMILNGSYILLGDLSKAITYAEDLVRFGEDSSDRQIWSWGLGSLGFTQNAAGRLKEAVSSLRKAIELSEAIPDYNTRVYAGGELGRCYLRQENLEAALKTLIEAEHFYDEHNVKGHFLSPVRNGLAEAHLLAAERSHGTERRNWLKKSKGCCRDALKQGKAFRPGLIEAMRLKGTYEWLAEKPTSAQKWWQRSSAAAEAGGMRYESGKTHLEMATRLKECAHLEKAKAIFAEIGIEYDLAQTPICACDP